MLRRKDSRKVARAEGIAVSARVLAVTAVALSSTVPALAGVNHFTVVGPDGGAVERVLIHPSMPSIAFALTGAGYYRSTDAGLTWSPVRPDMSNQPRDLAVDPSDPNRVIFAVPGKSPLLSTDAGATIAYESNFPHVPAGVTEVEFSTDGSVTYAASGVRIFRSTDGGRNWTERTPVVPNVANPNPLVFLRVNPLDSNVLYVLDLNLGGLRSTDGADSWQPFTFPAGTCDLVLTTTTPQQLWVASNTSGVHVSTNGGTTWPGAGLAQSTLSIAIDPVDPAIVYAGTSPLGLFRTTNAGGQWTNVHGNARVGQIMSIAIDRQQRSSLMLGGVSGIVATTTSGGTWQKRDRGIQASDATDMSAVMAAGRVYVNTVSSGVHFLANGAAGTTPVNNEALQQFQPTAVSSYTFGLLAQARGADRLFVGMSGGYVRSDDGGDAWQSGTTGIPVTAHRFADSPGDPDLIVASTFPGLHRSIDGGTSWTPVTAGLPAQPIATALAFAAAAPMTVYAGVESIAGGCCSYHGVYRSTDGGTTWSAANTGFASSVIRALAIDPTNAQVVYAGADAGGLLKTTNGGTSWSRTTWSPTPANALAVAIDPRAPNVVYVAGMNRFARSVDAGQTWQELRSEDARPYWQANALLVDPWREGVLLAATHSQGVVELTVAPDLAMEDMTAPIGTLPPGSQATHRFRLRNLGPFHALGARAVVSLPADTTNISATATNGTCLTQGTTVTCTTPVLELNASNEIVVSAGRSVLGTGTVVATASSDLTDSSAANNQVSHTVTFDNAPPPPPPPTNPGNSSSGGGGTNSLLWLLALAALRLSRRAR